MSLHRKRRSLAKRISHVAEYLGLLALVGLTNCIPYRWLQPCAGLVVTALYPFSGVARRRIKVNLRLCFPDLSDAEIRELTAKNLRHTVRVFLEVLQVRKFSRADFLDRHITTDGEDPLAAVRARTRGFVVMSGHLGNWELAAPFYARHGENAHFAMKHLSNPYVDRMALNTRQAYGGTPVFMEHSKKLLQEVRRNGFVGLVADQNARSAGILVDFFGIQTSSYQGPAMMAYLTGAPLFLCTCIHQGRGVYRFSHICISSDPQKEGFRDRNEAIQVLTQRWNQILEKEIRKHPEQYFWLHRRWKRSRVTVAGANTDATHSLGLGA